MRAGKKSIRQQNTAVGVKYLATGNRSCNLAVKQMNMNYLLLKHHLRLAPFLCCFLFIASCTEIRTQAQSVSSIQRVGGDCEGCEAIYENKHPFDKLSSELILPGFNIEPNSMRISGIVYREDKKTPAKGIVLYVYQTDKTGVYPKKGDEEGWSKRHGFIRGWLRTNEKGEYTIKTIRPGSYPGSTEPAHIHCIVKEPGINEYYIADFLFADDPYLKRKGLAQGDQSFPGGNGILKTENQKGMIVAKRDIILGENVQNYKRSATSATPTLQ